MCPPLCQSLHPSRYLLSDGNQVETQTINVLYSLLKTLSTPYHIFSVFWQIGFPTDCSRDNKAEGGTKAQHNGLKSGKEERGLHFLSPPFQHLFILYIEMVISILHCACNTRIKLLGSVGRTDAHHTNQENSWTYC